MANKPQTQEQQQQQKQLANFFIDRLSKNREYFIWNQEIKQYELLAFYRYLRLLYKWSIWLADQFNSTIRKLINWFISFPLIGRNITRRNVAGGWQFLCHDEWQQEGNLHSDLH